MVHNLARRPWICFLRAIGLIFGTASASCLPNATSQRRDLVNLVANESYPIGVWRNGDYAAARLTSRVAQILIEEKFGYNVELKGPGHLTEDGFFALAGCATPLDGANRRCGPPVTYVHINLETWTAGYPVSWDQVQADYPKMAPKNLGNMGYFGVSSHFIPVSVLQRAYEAEGINLDFYRDYNISWEATWPYFAHPSDLEVSKLTPCAQTALMSNEVMSNYARITADWAGVVVDSQGRVVGRCFDDYFWYAPACRGVPQTCLVWWTGGNGWGMVEMLTKAAVFNMPVATAVASSGASWVTVPTTTDVMLYWWVPDTTFLRLKPKKITFPDYNLDQWAKGDLCSAAPEFSIDTLVSQDLSTLAPEVEELMKGFRMSLNTIDQIMLDQLDTNDADYDVACRWLRSNEATWTTWLPETGKCYSQFGMYDELRETFLQTREGQGEIKITCRACPSGFFSALQLDDQGTTHICQACDSGYFQAFGAADSCDPCPAGSYQNETGSVDCNRCLVGEYQDEEGQRGCKTCPASSSTQLLGSASISECSCKAGSINIGGKALECIPCGEGLDCPFASSIETLQSGQSSSGEHLVASIRSGYFATKVAPLQGLKCRPEAWCPGGTPGTCAGGLEGEPCAVCPDGKTWDVEECADCGASVVGWAVGVAIGLVGIGAAYFFVNSEVTANATAFKTIQMAIGLAVTALQLLGILGLMSMKWPRAFSQTSSSLQILVLDLHTLGLSCLTGNNPVTAYQVTVAVFPFALFWLALCHLLSGYRCFHKCGIKPWKLPFTINTMGLGMQLGFGTVAAVSLKPLMCYRHPNGRHSVLSYPSIFCRESGHGLMVAFGVVLLVVMVVGFFTACGYAVRNLPRWSVTRQNQKVQSFRFCTSNFRFDSYWFVMCLLVRGGGLTLVVALGTNNPPAQKALASTILAVYGVVQASVRPWKAPAINLADTILGVTFLLLVSNNIKTDGDMESDFAETFAVALILLALACLALLAALCMLGLALQLAGVNPNFILHLGSQRDPMQVSGALHACAEKLMEIEATNLGHRIGSLNCYDEKTILNLIGLIEAEFQDDPGRRSRIPLSMVAGNTRVAMMSLNARLSVVLGRHPFSEFAPAQVLTRVLRSQSLQTTEMLEVV